MIGDSSEYITGIGMVEAFGFSTAKSEYWQNLSKYIIYFFNSTPICVLWPYFSYFTF